MRVYGIYLSCIGVFRIRFDIYNILYAIYKHNKTLNNQDIQKRIYRHKKKDISLLNNVTLNSMRFHLHSSKIIKMISHYQKRCDEKKTFPRRLLLSFAPVSSEKNIKFLKWLGVEIPAESEKLLKKDLSKMIDRSMEIAVNVLQQTLNYLNENNIVVPIGLNVEHIMSYNFQASIEMLQELSRIYREFCIKTEIY